MDDCVSTNIGCIPFEDYLDIVAMMNGFEDYQDLLDSGFILDLGKEC